MSDQPALRPELAVGEAVRAVARDILATARTAIEDTANSDAEAVHDFRRQMKRWRSLLQLLEPFLGAEAENLRVQARDLARALAGAREFQAALDALRDLEKHGLPLSDRSRATLRERISALKETQETTALTAAMRTELTAALDRWAAAVDQWPLHMLTFPDIAARLMRGYRAARRELPEDWGQADGEDLHELRKRIITHRYQMEIVQPLWQRFTRMWVGEAQRLRERLGQHQDLLMLENLTAPHQPLARWRSRLAPSIAECKRRHVAAAKRQAQRLFVEKPSSFRRRLEVMWETGG
jgi:CHAD domain-containing protein